MQPALNIPLGAPVTTRRDTGRIVAIAGGIVVGIFLGILAFRVPFAFSTTLGMSPEDSTTLRILKTAGTKELIDTNLGHAAIFPGAPWSISSLFAQSKSEMTIALLQNGGIAYIIDAPLSKNMQKTADAFGMYIRVAGKTSIIASSEVAKGSAALRVIPTALFPWHKGDISDGKANGTLTVTKKGITLNGVGIPADPSQIRVPTETNVLGLVSFSENSNSPVPAMLAPLLATPVGDVVSLLAESGGALLLTRDALGDGYVLMAPSGDLTSEQLAAVGKDLMNRSRLSTQEWTFEDGTSYDEIISNNDEVAVEVRAEEDFTYVSLIDTNGSIIRMTKTADLLTIANREIDIAKGERVESPCLRGAHSWLSRTVLGDDSPSDMFFYDTRAVFLKSFSEIAISNKKIRLCW